MRPAIALIAAVMLAACTPDAPPPAGQLQIGLMPPVQYDLVTVSVVHGKSCPSPGCPLPCPDVCVNWSAPPPALAQFQVELPSNEGEFTFQDHFELFPARRINEELVDAGDFSLDCGAVGCVGSLRMAVDYGARALSLDVDLTYPSRFNLCRTAYCVENFDQDQYVRYAPPPCAAGAFGPFCPEQIPCSGQVVRNGHPEELCPNPDVVSAAVTVRAHASIGQDSLE